MIVALHADIAVDFAEEYRRTLRRAAALAARERALVSVSIRATRAETGFGYVVPGGSLDADFPFDRGGAALARKYVEKPGEDEATALMAEGARWHSGILLASAETVMRELATCTPEVHEGFGALAAGDLQAFIRQVRNTSLERGLLERSRRLLVVQGEFGWDDVGTWSSLRRARELDDRGNGAIGEAHFVDADANVVHSERGRVVVFGLSGMLVVTLPGLTFITTLERAAELRPLLDALPGSMRIHPGGTA
jgi:mannose-1-phosphate guanylyltransferase